MNSNNKYKVILSKVEWCGHCKDFLPVFNESKNLIKNNKTFKNISVDFETFDMEQDKGIFETKYKELVDKIEGYPTVFLAQIKNDKLSKTVEIGHANKPGEFIKLISNAYLDFSKQKGGNQNVLENELYKQKYLKYKTKYLQYKMQLANKVCHNCGYSNQQTGGAINNYKIDKNLCNNCGNYK
jgi:thiol-disulfide isomerase/thioredoxin